MNLFPKGTVAAAIFTPERYGAAQPAFAGHGGATLSFAQTAEMTAALAAALLARGIVPGSRIGFLAPRGPLGVIGFLALSCLGPCCPLNPNMKAEELVAALAGLNVATLVDGAGSRAAAALPHLRVGLENDQVTLEGRPAAPGVIAIAPENAALLMRTSGTTSRAKLVSLTHGNILAAAAAIGAAFDLSARDLCLNPMPLHHVHGLISAALSSLLAGSAVHCMDGFSPIAFDEAAHELSPSWFTASPAMHLALRDYYEHADKKPAAGLRFFRSSSAPLPASAIDALEQLFDAPLIETYGLTETSSMVCTNPLPPALRKRGSVGVPYGGEIRVVDAAGRDAPVGGEGEIVIRGQSTITAYASDEAEGAFTDGWLRTGDVGFKDADGYLFIVGRAKELIKRGGLSVYPSEVDDALAAHPAVAEAVTFAVPHATLGEDVVAAVVLRAGANASEAMLRAALSAKISTYKVPSVILILDAIPKSETGKIMRRELCTALAAHLVPKRQPPTTPIERSLLDAWHGVLERDDIGVTDNLFLFGADPLRAGRLSDQTFGGWSPSLKELLAAPTVREQAALAQAAGGTR